MNLLLRSCLALGLILLVACSAVGQTPFLTMDAGKNGATHSCYGGQSVGAEAYVSNTEASNFTIYISSNNSCLQVPASITITGDETGKFTIFTHAVSVPTTVTITGTVTVEQTCTATLTFTVLPPLITGLDLGPGPGGPVQYAQGNTSLLGAVIVNVPAPLGGLIVSLASGKPSGLITVPGTVTIPAGLTFVRFPISFDATKTVEVGSASANSNGQVLSNQIIVFPATAFPTNFKSGIYLGGPFTGSILNRVNNSDVIYDYVWLIAQVFPNGKIWVSTYYSNKPSNGSWSTIKGYLQSSRSGQSSNGGVCLLQGVVNDQGNIIPSLKATVGVNNSEGPYPYEFLTDGLLNNSASVFDFASLGNSSGAAPYQGVVSFATGRLSISLSTVAGSVTAGPGTLAIQFQPSQSAGSFGLAFVH